MRWLLSSSSLFIILRFGKYFRIKQETKWQFCRCDNFVRESQFLLLLPFAHSVWKCDRFVSIIFKHLHWKYAIKIRQRFSCCRCERKRLENMCIHICEKLNCNWTDSGSRLIFKSLWINEFMCLSDDDYCLFVVNVRYNIRLSQTVWRVIPSFHICQFNHSFVVCIWLNLFA